MGKKEINVAGRNAGGSGSSSNLLVGCKGRLRRTIYPICISVCQYCYLGMYEIVQEPSAIILGILFKARSWSFFFFFLHSGLQIFNVLLNYVSMILSTMRLKMCFQ